ncbi:hypothetical protein [Sphingobacterium sp. BIGb0116]|uniref:hypothetical protein n=1 Tax=Sphingobacterium sp. BIGb0116 TaxID=2940619 RepID=UPI00216A45A9|nr:hypothetical protein [Sphingobacterium sp. BIGb0116]MCS4165211.1 hypothetical protein [Sphingobacterium sp. BIGb0116]
MWNDEVIKKATADQRLTVSHMALFFAIVMLCRRENGYRTIQTSRKVLMGKSHIGSLPTYHKCLKDLEKYNYVNYFPSYHPKKGSSISVLNFL